MCNKRNYFGLQILKKKNLLYELNIKFDKLFFKNMDVITRHIFILLITVIRISSFPTWNISIKLWSFSQLTLCLRLRPILNLVTLINIIYLLYLL